MGHDPGAARPAEDHLRRRHDAPASRPTAAGRRARGGLQATGIYDGETYDARLDQPGWDQPGFAGGWRERRRAHRDDRGRAAARRRRSGSSTRSSRSSVTQPTPGTYIYDLGQNFAGWARITRHRPGRHEGPAALRRDPERRRHALHRQPALGAADRHLHAARAAATETYEPRFTYHGFRYVEVTGVPARRRRRLDGRVVSPATCPEYGTFTSSNAARQPDPERDPLGPALELPRRAERRLASATSGSAGPVTSRRSPPPARSTGRLRLPRPVAADAARQPERRRRLPGRRAGHLLRRGHRRLGRRGHGRALGALPPLRRPAHPAGQLRRDDALDRLPEGQLQRT